MSSPLATSLRLRPIDTVPVPLSLVTDQAKEGLHLRASGAGDWGRAQRLLDRLRAAAHRGTGRFMRLDTLACEGTPMELRLRDTRSVLGPNEDLRIPAAEISSLRLRVVQHDRGLLRLSLSIVRTGDHPAISALFSMTELDRDDEALDLGLRLARCLGLSGYRVRHGSPADIELVPKPDPTSPYRSAPRYLPVPSSAGSIDYGARASDTSPRSKPREVSQPRHHGSLFDGWRIDAWQPGQRIALSKDGKTRRGAWLSTGLVGVPLALIITSLVAALYAGGLMLIAAMLLFLPVALVCIVIGTDPPMWLAYLLGAWGIGSALFASFAGLSAGIDFGTWWHEDGQSRTWLLDWEHDEVVESWGGRAVARAPLHEFQTIGAPTFRALATAETNRGVPMVLEGVGEDLELFQWVAPAPDDRQDMANMVTDLAAALAASSAIHTRA